MPRAVPDTGEQLSFKGFPASAVEFYQQLELNNSKEWWIENAHVYAASVKSPMASLLAELGDEFGAAKVFRPHRDVRFSADKSPYKTHQGGYVPTGTGTGWYVQIGAQGLYLGGGIYAMQPDQLARYREAVDTDRYGEALVSIVDSLRDSGFEVGGDQLASRPRGVAADHPRVPLLRHKSLIVFREYGEPPWLGSPDTAQVVRQDWRSIRPLVEWLGAHVGSSDRETGPRQRKAANRTRT